MQRSIREARGYIQKINEMIPSKKSKVSGPDAKVSNIIVLSGSSNNQLAKMIAVRIGLSLGNLLLAKFSNGEIRVQVHEKVRGKDVFIVQTGCGPVHEYLYELQMMVQACKLESAAKVIAVIPCFPYARQDRKDKKGVAITAKIVANNLTGCGVDHVITMDIHAPQVQGFFNIPVTNLSAERIIIEFIIGNIPEWKTCVIVSPDAGGTKRATRIAEALNLQFATCHKERTKANEVFSFFLAGDVSGKPCIIIDDMIDTAGTIIQATQKLLEARATRVYAMATHGVLSGPGLDRINSAPLTKVIVTNTIPQESNASRSQKIRVIDVSWIFAHAIREFNES